MKSDMYYFAFSIVFLLSSLALSKARTILISRSDAKTYLPGSECDVCMTPTCVRAAAGILKSLDQTLDPCEDFYNFACGGWMDRNDIPEDDVQICPGKVTRMELDRQLKEILKKEDKNSDLPFVKNIKNYYKTCSDENIFEKQGSEPLKKILRRLGGWPVVEGSHWNESTFDWVDTLISFRKIGYDYKILLDLGSRYDNANVLTLDIPDLQIMLSATIANLTLGLADPDVVTYYKMMVKAAKLLGAEEAIAEKEMLEVLRFMTTLLNIKRKAADLVGETPEELTVAEFQRKVSKVPWLKIINGLLLNKDVDENQIISFWRPEYFPKFADLITSSDKRVIANYMLWQAVWQSKDYLSQEWKNLEADQKYDFRKRSQSTKKYRWMECLARIKYDMDIGLASYYVRHYFIDETKDEAIMMMKYIHKEFLKLLKENDWIDEKTKRKAEEKANALKSFIGYPKELLNDTFMIEWYENLTMPSDSYLECILSYKKWEKDRRLLKFNHSYEEYSWKGSAKFRRILFSGAFYNKEENSMAIPAGILHEPFLHKDRPKYMNFATIGHIIGHEITHGFDNKGRHYDKNGEIVNWWDEESDKHYGEKVKCIIDQYDNYTTDIGIKVNGEKTQNENIADNGGMKEAYLAYQSWTRDNGLEPLLPGVNYTQNQLFWISSAVVYCAKYRPDALEKKILLDSHSPAKFRVIGPLSNSPQFSKDFNCPADAPMNRKYKCGVW